MSDLSQSGIESVPLTTDEENKEKQPIEHEGRATIASSSFNLTKTIVGCGIMTLPYNLKNCGWVFGILCLLLVGISSTYGFHLLTVASAYTGSFQYRDISSRLYNKRISIFIAIMVIVYTFGSLASYCIVIRDNMFWWPEDAEGASWKRRLALWSIMCIVILPICFLPRINFLRFTSLIALSSIFYVICVVASFCILIHTVPGLSMSIDPPVSFNWSIDTFTSFPLFTTAFCGHYNMPNIYYELKNRSISRMNWVTLITSIVTIVFNSTMSLFGYFAFTSAVKSDILKNIASLSNASVFFYIANSAMILVIIFSYPLVTFGVRKAIESVAWPENRQVPYKWTVLIIVLLVTIPTLLATFISDMDMILSFTASICGSPVVYIIPGMFGYTVARRSKGPRHLAILSMTLVVLGFFYAISGFVSSVYTIIIRPTIK
ncbi:putative Amino acid transporter system N2 [Giardia muris]|uniref:Putative Amino acid transporter system N2 n=1 Tax=Giardia muris TaxID=5742 RepID=A0A4Z1SYA7_GIAMU|nr:putative Amino acid transporter system N2 [Giardia muris]|eukprot:TNJ30684.1 putative Amino acid transporter system N2 [Giardia muris]